MSDKRARLHQQIKYLQKRIADLRAERDKQGGPEGPEGAAARVEEAALDELLRELAKLQEADLGKAAPSPSGTNRALSLTSPTFPVEALDDFIRHREEACHEKARIEGEDPKACPCLKCQNAGCIEVQALANSKPDGLEIQPGLCVGVNFFTKEVVASRNATIERYYAKN